MKKFRFRLDTVLRQREIVEDTKKRDLGIARQALEIMNSRKRTIEDELEMTLYAREKLGEQPTVRIQDFLVMDYFIQGAKNRIVEAQNKVVLIEEEVNRRLQRYVEAHRDTKIIDRLKEKAKHEHHRMALKDQENKSNDIQTVRFAHRLSESSSGEEA